MPEDVEAWWLMDFPGKYEQCFRQWVKKTNIPAPGQ